MATVWEKTKVVVSKSWRSQKIYHSYHNYKNNFGCVGFGTVMSRSEAEELGYRPCKISGCMTPGGPPK